MIEIALLKMAHILCLVYWLGGDLGVFYSSFIVTDREQPAPVRVAVAKVLFALDQAPRICMPLMFATGVQLASLIGFLQWPSSLIATTWIVCAIWLGLVVILHAKGAAAKALTRFDFYMRVAVIAALVIYAVYALSNQLILPWLGIKILIFAGLVTCGLIIRYVLKPFGPAFVALATGTAQDRDHDTINACLRRSRPFVLLIWLGLLVNTALGLHVF